VQDKQVIKQIRTYEDLLAVGKLGLSMLRPGKPRIQVGAGTCGLACGASKTYNSIKQELASTGWDALLVETGCLGLCQEEPLVDIIIPNAPRLVYRRMTADLAAKLIQNITSGDCMLKQILMKMDFDENALTGEKVPYSENGRRQDSNLQKDLDNVVEYEQQEFFGKQLKIALRNCGFIDSDSIEEYIARGGYAALYKALFSLDREEIINQVEKSGLRGRGGGGFLTGKKWRSCYNVQGDVKYVICNADEGDPGAYMDRTIIEGDPHSVLEGMLIGAYSIGATEGYIYVRAEYPLAIKKLVRAIEQARQYGLLGDRIFGTDFSFDIKISKGGGAFVCGESSALIASIEGKPGEPRAKHIHMAESGLWGKPTVLNNVETWANAPVIVSRGADWFASIGAPTSTGTKVFSVVGKVKRTGLVEVPMGMTLREIVFDIGGGIEKDRKFKAVQTGGPSGGCLPEAQLDIPVDFDKLWDAGSMMGSGGMIVMDERTCMVDLARYFTEFLADESCGKCTPCREGLRQMLFILERICKGEGQPGDIERLEELGDVMTNGSLCGLGTSAPNPVLSTIRYFRNEYDAHINDKKCPAGICPALITYNIIEDKCVGCGACMKKCPTCAIVGEKKSPHKIIIEKCVKCGACYETCKFEAVRVI